jgi:hypothetical protein
MVSVYARSFPFENSFFVIGRLGYMQTVHGHPDSHVASGPAYGIDIGQAWYYSSGFHQGVTSVGGDSYLNPKNSSGLAHGLRYEIGFSF